MTDPDQPPELPELKQRLGKIRDRRAGEQAKSSSRSKSGASDIGVGAKVVVDLVAGVGFGGGIGWSLDWWLGTKPWLLVVFLMLGFVAGLLNVIRTADQASRRKTNGDTGA
ncbi:MAG: AtpZ/AtpI family protein [Alphaproteobacteria bacterium]|jgi:ATP synthase protein I